MKWLTPRISIAPGEPASRPDSDIVSMIEELRPHPRVARRARVRPDGPDLEAEGAPEE